MGLAIEEILTTSDLQKFENKIVGLLEQLQPALKNAMDRWMSVNDVSEETGHSRLTVISWIRRGKRDRHGKIYRLEAEEFAPGHYRVLRSKLIEYGQIKDCVAVTPERKRKRAA